MSGYKIPIKKDFKKHGVKTVMFRVPPDLYEVFNRALEKSKLSAQNLVEDMVRFCLVGSDEETKEK